MKYNVWIQVEGVDKNGDCVPGYADFSLKKVGRELTKREAIKLAQFLESVAEQYSGTEGTE